MSKQLSEAYIVAATRAPIGKSGRGMFRNTRPDDLLVAVIQAALAQVPTLDPAAIEDAIVGCAMPEGEQGLNFARTSVLLAGLQGAIVRLALQQEDDARRRIVRRLRPRIRFGLPGRTRMLDARR